MIDALPTMGPDRAGAALLDGLTPAQELAVTCTESPLCILASAGSGKTRVLTRRIAWRCRTGVAAEEHTLAVTFTRRAAGELQHRLAALGLRRPVAAGTFHSHAAAQLQRWWADRRAPRPALLERKSRILGPLLAGRPGLEGVALADVAAVIEWARARDIEPSRLAEAVAGENRSLPGGAPAEAVASVYARYCHEKRRRGLIDFDDLLVLCAEALETDPDFAGAIRWRWRHVYVDEFQDLNPLQHRLLRAWLGSSTDLCVVGDPNQSVYGWNGADPALLTGMPDRWPTTRVIRLDANHRCTEQVVRAAAAVLGPAGQSLTAAGREGPQPTVTSFRDPLDEARSVAGEVTRAVERGLPVGAMAVLARTNAQLVPVERALTELGVRTWSPAACGLLDDPEVADFLTAGAEQRHRPLAALIGDLAAAVRESAQSPQEALPQLLTLARSFAAAGPDATVGEWLQWLPAATGHRGEGAGSGDAVTLGSFHRAKGLEWQAVWVIGVEEGLVPMGKRLSAAQEQEERQLLYVALTRAAEELSVSWCRTRSFGGPAVGRQPSRWLPDLEAAISGTAVAGAVAGPASVAEWRARLAAQREALGQASRSRGRPAAAPPGWGRPRHGDMTALKAWRAEAARQSGVPPHLILHDRTLEAIAALRPKNPEELMALPGVGPLRAGRYGAAILATLFSFDEGVATSA